MSSNVSFVLVGRYIEIKDMDFTSCHTKKKKMDQPDSTTTEKKKLKVIPAMVPDEVSKMYADLAKSGIKPGVLSLVENCAEKFIPEAASTQLPSPLTMLFQEEAMKFDEQTLKTSCVEAFQSLTLTVQQVSVHYFHFIDLSKLRPVSNICFDHFQ
jgi:hypothetical protein